MPYGDDIYGEVPYGDTGSGRLEVTPKNAVHAQNTKKPDIVLLVMPDAAKHQRLSREANTSVVQSLLPEKSKHRRKSKEVRLFTREVLQPEKAKHIHKITEPVVSEQTPFVHSVDAESTIHTQKTREALTAYFADVSPDKSKHIRRSKDVGTYVRVYLDPKDAKHNRKSVKPDFYASQWIEVENAKQADISKEPSLINHIIEDVTPKKAIHLQKAVKPEFSVWIDTTVKNAKQINKTKEAGLEELAQFVQTAQPEKARHLTKASEIIIRTAIPENVKHHIKSREPNIYIGHWVQSDDSLQAQKAGKPVLSYQQTADIKNAKHLDIAGKSQLEERYPFYSLSPKNAKQVNKTREVDNYVRVVMSIDSNLRAMKTLGASAYIPGLTPIPTDNLTIRSLTDKRIFSFISDGRDIEIFSDKRTIRAI